MPKIEHHAPRFYYEVWWKRDIPGSRWESYSIPKWEQGEYTVANTPTFEKYLVKVIAGNELGQARSPVREVEGYSGEDGGFYFLHLDGDFVENVLNYSFLLQYQPKVRRICRLFKYYQLPLRMCLGTV